MGGAGRLTQVLHEGLPVKEYFYARSNGSGNYTRGKLVATKRRNLVLARNGEAVIGNHTTGDIVITEELAYTHPAGLLTHRETRSSDGRLFHHSYTYL